ncbi:MAG: hypothetical protein HOE14_10955 [Gemmatimonadales bacterium]|nr:hypothetical protein [Gemmatimonadales bacterium]
MERGTVAVSELVGVIDGAATAFGWARSYKNVVATTIGAAYRAAGLDEDTDRIAVDPGSAESIAARIVETAELDGLSPRTATTYASTWKRLAGLAHAWHLAGCDAAFWDDAEHLRSRRARKRRSRTDRSDNGQTVTVDTSAGPATITLPDRITDEDRLRVVQAILELGSIDG